MRTSQFVSHHSSAIEAALLCWFQISIHNWAKQLSAKLKYSNLSITEKHKLDSSSMYNYQHSLLCSQYHCQHARDGCWFIESDVNRTSIIKFPWRNCNDRWQSANAGHQPWLIDSGAGDPSHYTHDLVVDCAAINYLHVVVHRSVRGQSWDCAVSRSSVSSSLFPWKMKLIIML